VFLRARTRRAIALARTLRDRLAGSVLRRGRRNAPRAPSAAQPTDFGPAAGGKPRRFVASALGGAALVLLVVGGVNAYVDPYGYTGTAAFPTAILSDRTTKACLAQRLTSPPRLLVLGSSRSMKIQPSYMRALTGSATFNAGVSSATPQDAWAFVNFLHDRFPAAHQRVLWMVDVEMFRPKPLDPGLLATPALSRYFSASAQWSARLSGLPTLLSWHTASDSWRVLSASLFRSSHARTHGQCTYRTNGVTQFTANGFRLWDIHDAARARGFTLDQGVALTIQEYSRIYRSGYPALSPGAEHSFARTVGLLNQWGVRPLLVLTPVQPRLLKAIGPLGWNRRHAEVVSYLRRLQGQASFDLLDASHISSFGGRPGDFYDGVHMMVPNLRRLAAWAVSHHRADLS
jgi:hypothetical protein